MTTSPTTTMAAPSANAASGSSSVSAAIPGTVASAAVSNMPPPPSRPTPTQTPSTPPARPPRASHNQTNNLRVGHVQLGDCIGRGAFGSVFRGLNWTTGETVAVKQVRATNLGTAQLQEMMAEIELLRNLNHPNIVKYKGSERSREHLFIILEYCENGSLQHICKRFGKFPEGLVAIYISQILEGLVYLHEQGVIHRDIKGANILTTKDGSVKLADFGVAIRAGALSGNNTVVGSPYWMAPEVIDQSGATTASDIWSVGCVVIELLEGKPPYHHLDPMPALFRIVQDDCPPLPEGASPMVKDFLMHCFQKDVNLRITAKKLCRHPWIVAAKRQLEQMRYDPSIRGGHDEAVKSVKEWNEAIAGEPTKPLATGSRESKPVNPPSSNLPSRRENGGQAPPQSPKPTAHVEDNDATIRPPTATTADRATSPVRTNHTAAGRAQRVRVDTRSGQPVMLSATDAPPSVSPSTKPTKRAMDGSRQSPLEKLSLYAEEEQDEEDYSDLLDDEGPLPLDATKLRLRSVSMPTSDREEDAEEDPFAEIEREGVAATANLEANIARDRHARMCMYVVELFDRLKADAAEEILLDTCDELEVILTDHGEMKAQALAAHGALAVTECLEAVQVRDVIARLLGLLNVITYDDIQAQESLCLLGAIPVVMPFCSKQFPHHVRIEAAHFMFNVCSTSSLTLQFVLSCRGLKTLVELIDEDYMHQRDLVCLGIACLNAVMELQGPASRTDFCRLLARDGLLEPLSNALTNLLEDREHNPHAEPAMEYVLQILLTYSSADLWLKEQLASRNVLRRLLQACKGLDARSLTQLLKAIKNLTMSPTLLDDIENCNAIEVLIDVLAARHNGPYGNEIANQILNATYNLCRLNVRRQEEAAQAGLVPHLVRVAQTGSPSKQFAIPILCDMAQSSKSTRKRLNQQCGLHFFLDLLQDANWQSHALESICVWLYGDLARVEEYLLRPDSIAALVTTFVGSKARMMENLLETFLRIFKVSNGITLALGQQPSLLDRLADGLQHASKAIVRLNLLRMCKAICDVHTDMIAVVHRSSLGAIVQTLSNDDSAILIRELAREIVQQWRQQQQQPRPLPQPLRPSSVSRDAAQRAVRRAASETNVGVHRMRSGHPSSSSTTLTGRAASSTVTAASTGAALLPHFVDPQQRRAARPSIPHLPRSTPTAHQPLSPARANPSLALRTRISEGSPGKMPVSTVALRTSSRIPSAPVAADEGDWGEEGDAW